MNQAMYRLSLLLVASLSKSLIDLGYLKKERDLIINKINKNMRELIELEEKELSDLVNKLSKEK